MCLRRPPLCRRRPIPHAHKIAKCSYCGTQAALVLGGRLRHELACSSCGAPLHELKQMPLSRDRMDENRPHMPAINPAPTHKTRKQKKKKYKKRKSWARKLASELFDVVEDIFD